MIRVPAVRVVDEEGSQLGVLPTMEALRLAQERGYDLVEVAPMAVPPVVRLLDYGQYKYEAAKKEKEARRHQRSVDFKEIRLKPKIATGDFDTRVRRAIQFLEDGDRVKVACQFRGRELTHANLGRDLLMRFAERIKDYGVVERQPLLEGKSMSIVVASTHKPKVVGSAAPEGRPAESAPQPAPSAPQPAPSASQPAPQQGVAAAPAAPGEAGEAIPESATNPEPVAEQAPPEPRADRPATRATSSRASTPRPTRTGGPVGGTSPQAGSAGE